MTSAPTDNKLLASLSKGDYELFQGDLEAVSLKLGETLCDSGRPLRYAYFPTTSIVSMNYLMQSGSSTEVAGIGFEGVVGHALFMGGESTTCSAVVQTAGLAYRLDKNVLLREFARGGGLRKILLRHVQSLMTQIGQTAVCNRHHSIDQQLCRWLLQTIDRLSGNELTMTQELISNMLGVRREAITEAAGRLQAAGCISYRRGHITVTNRKSLESRTCECYETVRSELKRLAAFDCGGRVH